MGQSLESAQLASGTRLPVLFEMKELIRTAQPSEPFIVT
jgi:hypothetical protein